MEHTPPPFFRRGPAPLVRLAFFASLSIALLIADARFKYVDSVRTVLALIAFPLQQAAAAPEQLLRRLGSYFVSQSALSDEVASLRKQLVENAQNAQRLDATTAELAQLRRLVGAQQRLGYQSTPIEVLYAGRDAFSRKVIVDKGSLRGLVPGQAVIDENGVVGQLTRVYPMVAEVTLLTDKEQAIPVQVVRNGLRAVAFGAGNSGMLELRFLAANAEIEPGDRIVTSGIDGTYPAGLPVATVSRIDRDAAAAFARILCQPAAGIEHSRYLLALAAEGRAPDYPEEATPAGEKKSRGKQKRKREARDAG
jgi:rod shape-determining protein MreC